MTLPTGRFVAFADGRRVGIGALAEAAAAARRALDRSPDAQVLVFNGETGEVVDLDLRGSEADVVARLEAPAASGRGRPKLGVVAREVTLLPRHWDWLARQPGGASAALRRLVETARREAERAGTHRTEAAYRFMGTMAGNLPGFEEAARALFAGDRAKLAIHMFEWPVDIRNETLRLLKGDA